MFGKIKSKQIIGKSEDMEHALIEKEWLNKSLFPKKVEHFHKDDLLSNLRNKKYKRISQYNIFTIDSTYKDVDDENGNFSLNQLIYQDSLESNDMFQLSFDNYHTIFHDRNSLIRVITNIKDSIRKPFGLLMNQYNTEFDIIVRTFKSMNIYPDFIHIKEDNTNSLYYQIHNTNKLLTEIGINIPVLVTINTNKFDILKALALKCTFINTHLNVEEEIVKDLCISGNTNISSFSAHQISVLKDDKIFKLSEIYNK